MLFEQEGQPPISNPSWEDVASSLSSINPRERSFFVLSGKSGYVQVAGAKLRLTIEHRKKGLFSSAHYRLGRAPVSSEEIDINYSGGAITVRKSEVLSLDDALKVLRSYFDHGVVPDDYVSRELPATLR
jgi:hypothetical protein